MFTAVWTAVWTAAVHATAACRTEGTRLLQLLFTGEQYRLYDTQLPITILVVR